MALIEPSAQIFPQVTTGGGRETVEVIVNMSQTRVDFTKRLYDNDGNRLSVRTFPEGTIITTNAAHGWLALAASFNFTLYGITAQERLGWATLAYDSSNARLGGYAAFCYRAGGVINEGLVLEPFRTCPASAQKAVTANQAQPS